MDNKSHDLNRSYVLNWYHQLELHVAIILIDNIIFYQASYIMFPDVYTILNCPISVGYHLELPIAITFDCEYHILP